MLEQTVLLDKNLLFYTDHFSQWYSWVTELPKTKIYNKNDNHQMKVVLQNCSFSKILKEVARKMHDTTF
jgi:hypothetical protein